MVNTNQTNSRFRRPPFMVRTRQKMTLLNSGVLALRSPCAEPPIHGRRVFDLACRPPNCQGQGSGELTHTVPSRRNTVGAARVFGVSTGPSLATFMVGGFFSHSARWPPVAVEGISLGIALSFTTRRSFQPLHLRPACIHVCSKYAALGVCFVTGVLDGVRPGHAFSGKQDEPKRRP